jgi:hypothetical protein
MDMILYTYAWVLCTWVNARLETNAMTLMCCLLFNRGTRRGQMTHSLKVPENYVTLVSSTMDFEKNLPECIEAQPIEQQAQVLMA